MNLRYLQLSSLKGFLFIFLMKSTFSKRILCGLISRHLILQTEDAKVIKLRFEPIFKTQNTIFFNFLKAQRS